MSGAEFHEPSLAQAGDDPKLQGAVPNRPYQALVNSDAWSVHESVLY